MKFGLNDRKNITGTGLYIKAFQVASILPLIYIFTATGYMGILSKRSVLSVLFDIGMSCIPRIEAILLSLLYRASSSEIAVYFTLIAIALCVGIAYGKLSLKGDKTGIIIRKAAAVLITADLIIRLFTTGFNRSFGTAAFAIGFAVRLISLALVIFDLRQVKKTI